MSDDEIPVRVRLWGPTEKAIKHDTAVLRAAVLRARSQAVWGEEIAALDDVDLDPHVSRYFPPRPHLDEVLATEPPPSLVRAAHRLVLVLAEADMLLGARDSAAELGPDGRAHVSGYADGNADESIEVYLSDLGPGLHEVIARRRRYRLGEIPDDVTGVNFVEQDPYPWTTVRRDASWDALTVRWRLAFTGLVPDAAGRTDIDPVVLRVMGSPILGAAGTSVRMTPRAILGD